MGEVTALRSPEPLTDHHELEDFHSGEHSLDEWLKRRARVNQISGASRTYVVCEANRVAGFYALASGGVTANAATGRFRRNMPDPIPVIILGRLTVDERWQGRGISRALFRDAAMRVEQAADAIGIRGILVHAISEQAKIFYLALGFSESPLDPMTLMVTIADIRSALDVKLPDPK